MSINKKLLSTNDSVALYPTESVTVTESGSKYLISADADFTCYFNVNAMSKIYSVQIAFETVDDTGEILFYSSVNGTDYDNVVDDAGDNVGITVTGSDATTTINNYVASFGTVKIAYVNGANTTGTISINVIQ